MRQGKSEKSLQEEIRSLAESLGMSDIGFGDITGLNSHGFTGCTVMALRLAEGVLREMDDAPTFNYYHHYRMTNMLLDTAAARVALLIEERGYAALPIPASQSHHGDNRFISSFPHKTGATRSGMGSVGKSGLFLHRRFGPAVRLVSVLTNAPLPYASPVTLSGCGECEACRNACPAGAIRANTWYCGIEREKLYDPKMCSEFMKAHFSDIGRGFVCGLCIKVCIQTKFRYNLE